MINRRSGLRVPARLIVHQYDQNSQEHQVCMSFNLGTEGIYLYHRPEEQVPHIVGLEFQIPDAPESIWARGEVRFSGRFGPYRGTGIAFTAMASKHWDWVQDWVFDSRLQQVRSQLPWLPSAA
jgi:hypothetical protein